MLCEFCGSPIRLVRSLSGSPLDADLMDAGHPGVLTIHPDPDPAGNVVLRVGALVERYGTWSLSEDEYAGARCGPALLAHVPHWKRFRLHSDVCPEFASYEQSRTRAGINSELEHADRRRRRREQAAVSNPPPSPEFLAELLRAWEEEERGSKLRNTGTRIHREARKAVAARFGITAPEVIGLVVLAEQARARGDFKNLPKPPSQANQPTEGERMAG